MSCSRYPELQTAWLVLTAWDAQVAAHGEHVARELMRLAPADEQEVWQWAGRLHDLGKITLPATILYKRGSLTRRERRTMQEHSLRGAALLKQLHAPPIVIDGAKFHHERWDSTGYPFDIGQEQIPLVARVLAVADVYCTLTNDRPYRHAVSPNLARAEIERNAGTQFDPGLVKIFFAHHNDE